MYLKYWWLKFIVKEKELYEYSIYFLIQPYTEKTALG